MSQENKQIEEVAKTTETVEVEQDKKVEDQENKVTD